MKQCSQMQEEMIAMLESGIDPNVIVHLLIAREGQKLVLRLQRKVTRELKQAMEYHNANGARASGAMCSALEQAATYVCLKMELF